MLNYQELFKTYATTSIEPDIELIKYAYALKKNGQAVDLTRYVGMLKYIVENGISKYKKEYALLIKLFM